MESVSGSDVRLRRVGTVGLRRVGAVGLGTGQDKSSRAGCTDTWQCHVGSVRGHCYRVLSQATHHRVRTQGTATGYYHRIPSQGTRHWKHCHESLPRISAADQNHSGI